MKLKVKGACTVRIALSCCSTNGEEPLITIEVKRERKKAFNGNVSTTLLKRIQACSTASELMALLFTTPAKDEAVMAAFDKRIEELEQQQTINIHPLKRNNNGSTTHNATK